MRLNDHMYNIIEEEFRNYARESMELNEDQMNYEIDVDAYDEYGNESEDGYYIVSFVCLVDVTHYNGDYYQPAETEVSYTARVVNIVYVKFLEVGALKIPVDYDPIRMIYLDEVYY